MGAALFPSVIKIYETSWQFREAADPSVYDNWRDYFATKPVILNSEMTGMSDKTLMRIHLFIVPYFVAAAVMALVWLIPNMKTNMLSGSPWLSLRSVLRMPLHFPKTLQIVFPARITVGELAGVVIFLCMNWGIFVSRVERSLFRGSRKLTFLVDADKKASKAEIDPSSWQACEVWALTLGILAILNMGWYLFLPIGKRSVFLDMFGVSWDSAIKYHRWIGYYTFWLSVAHGAMYLAIFYAKNGDSKFDPDGVLVKHNLNGWGCNGEGECDEEQQLMLRRNMYGIAAMSLLMVMVLCSIEYVRRRFFNTFYVMHHLVFVVLLFLCLHYKGTIILILPGLSVYLIDKLLGLLAFSNSVPASAAVVSPGVVEVTAPLPSSSTYHAGQYVQVNVPAASVLEWHPFSITSAPHHNSGRQLTFHIKALGDWTDKVLAAASDGSLQVRLDGYYGHDMAGPMASKAAAVLVGGGIGVTPMMSVAMELLEGGGGGGGCRVHLLWVVRTVDEFNIFGAKLAAAAAAYPDRLAVKVWITLSGADSNLKEHTTAESVVRQLGIKAVTGTGPSLNLKDQTALRLAAPAVAPNRWTLPAAGQALVTAVAILTATAAFGLSQYVGSDQNEWSPDGQRVLDLLLVLLALLAVTLLALLAMILAPLLRPARQLESQGPSTPPLPADNPASTILMAHPSPETTKLPSFSDSSVPGLGGDSPPIQVVHGSAFGYCAPNPMELQAYPQPYPVTWVYGGYPPVPPQVAQFPGPATAIFPGHFGQSTALPAATEGPVPQAAAAAEASVTGEEAARGCALRMLEGRIGSRPDISAEFEAIAAAAEAPLAAGVPVDIGALACGPQQLVAKVAGACNGRRGWGLLNRQPVYSFTEEDWDW